MEIQILPIMVNDDLGLSLHVASSADPKKFGIAAFSHDGTPDKSIILSHLPKDILAQDDTDDLSVKIIPHPTKPETLIAVVTATENNFAPPVVNERGRWVSPGGLKFGPLPQGVEDARPLQNLYTGSFAEPDLTTIFSGLMTVQSGNEDNLNNYLSTVNWERLSQRPQLIGMLMDAPKFDPRKTASAISGFKMSRRMFGRLAVELGSVALHGFRGNVQGAKAAASRANDAAYALSRRMLGKDPKPA